MARDITLGPRSSVFKIVGVQFATSDLPSKIFNLYHYRMLSLTSDKCKCTRNKYRHRDVFPSPPCPTSPSSFPPTSMILQITPQVLRPCPMSFVSETVSVRGNNNNNDITCDETPVYPHPIPYPSPPPCPHPRPSGE